MRRALAALASGALLLAAPTLPPGPLSAAPAGAAECTWQRHSKRIVKYVRRDGKLRRVVRRRAWWRCVPAPALGAPPPLVPAPAPTPEPTPGPEPETAPHRVSVKALEYSFTLSRPSVWAGEVTIELNNQGEDPHNLNLEPESGLEAGEAPLEIAETGPDASRTASFALPVGRYRLWCSLEPHDEWGMHATLTVAEGG